ncbi:hypothetical protein O1611_g2341 [Lasiodiplodia mahajangana]|uniref:Uncharacterized protein n=1 Tax=Lasiodiplodia mahajangana TaxID=1108764 RepID=A0ACC2JUT2_9PEZI|nr:hypothetical protein O1611_g2341 [Lasiodiplodia mahajangana]
MGGRVWSTYEERCFWRSVVSQSPKRAGDDISRPEKSWAELAHEMQVMMGNNARREYTSTMLFEHYFQNVEGQRHSPNAVPYVLEYLAKRGKLSTEDVVLRKLCSQPVYLDRPRHLVNDEDGPHPYSATAPGHHVPFTAPGRHVHFATQTEIIGDPQQQSHAAQGRKPLPIIRSS